MKIPQVTNKITNQLSVIMQGKKLKGPKGLQNKRQAAL